MRQSEPFLGLSCFYRWSTHAIHILQQVFRAFLEYRALIRNIFDRLNFVTETGAVFPAVPIHREEAATHFRGKRPRRGYSKLKFGARALLIVVQITGFSGFALAQDDQDQQPVPGNPTRAAGQTDPGTKAAIIGDIPIPEIITDLEALPFPTRKMRDLILTAARTGDIEKLRPYLGYGDDVTMLSLGGFDGDPIEFLKSLSGDTDGHEILAIITEILEAPPAKSEAMEGEAIYIWPYFYSYPFDKLTDAQRVQMYRIITHGDFEEMIQYGSYIFYRLGITPEGRWQFFVAGD